jgi:CRP-like cAMP-binding protein
LARAAPTAKITNRLLDRLPEKDRVRVLSGCDQVDLVLHETLAEPGSTIRNVYFPLAGFISLLTPMGGKDTLEVALAGNEGMYGAPVALGVDISPLHALVQGAGSALQMGTATFRRDIARMPAFRSFVDRYIYVLMTQLTQTAGCNRFHVVEQRVARWLLMTADRAHSPSFQITHEFLSHMLGVRRVGITKAAGTLQKRKLIRYTRGNVTILDRKGLERASCACYRADLATYDRVFASQAA